MKFKTGDEARVKRTNKETMYKHIEGTTVLILNNVCGDLYKVCDCIGGQWILDEEMLEPADSKTLRMADGTIIGEFNTGGTVSIHDLPTSEWYNPVRLTFKNGSSIEALPQKDDDITTLKPRDGSMGFESPYLDLSCFILPTNSREFEEKINKELAEHFNAFLNNGISAKNGGKNSMKFTFYTIEGYRMDKSNNTKIPTVTTEVVYKDKDGCATGGSATCDKADYNSRQGVLEALANMCCGGNFDREYNKTVKDNARADKISRTCTYCGQLFDTVAEKEVHEAWHVERRKARHERYLLRKRAKEIAFEEQAQKMAKEMMGEQK